MGFSSNCVATDGRTAIPENREFKKWKFSFFCQRHALSTSFDIFVVTYRVTKFLPKLMDMLLFSMEKNWISIFCFPYFPVLPGCTRSHARMLSELKSFSSSWELCNFCVVNLFWSTWGPYTGSKCLFSHIGFLCDYNNCPLSPTRYHPAIQAIPKARKHQFWTFHLTQWVSHDLTHTQP